MKENITEIPVDTTAAEKPQEQVKRRKFTLPDFMKNITKKNIIVLCSLLLIGGAVYLNWMFFAGGSESDGDGYVIDYTASGGQDAEQLADIDNNASGASDEASYFASATLSRQRARDEAIEVFRTVINSDEALEEIKSEAAVGINNIAERIEQEANIESLICAKGFEECVAVLADNSANVIVKSTGLMPNEVAQIKEIVCEQSGLPATAVKIIESEGN